jgi:hypothetical protein
MKLLWPVIALALCVFAAACDDGGDGTDASGETPEATAAAAFDPAVLTATVLNASDEPGFDVTGVFSPADPSAGGRSFTSYLNSDTPRIQSTVARYPTEAAANEDFQRNRIVLPTFGAREENFVVDDAEIAFLYHLRRPGLGMWAITGNYVMFVQMNAINEDNPDPAATDIERMRRYANIVASRVATLVNDPSSVEPIPLSEFNTAPPETAPAGDATPAATPQR